MVLPAVSSSSKAKKAPSVSAVVAFQTCTPPPAARTIAGRTGRVDQKADPAVRLAMVVETEAQQRTMLRLSLEADEEARSRLVLRQGRLVAWIEDALRPLEGRVAAADLRRLTLAVRATIGIESFVWLVDVAGLAVATMRWSAGALLRDTVAAYGPADGGRPG